MSHRTMSFLWIAFVLIFLTISGAWLVGWKNREDEETSGNQAEYVFAETDTDETNAETRSGTSNDERIEENAKKEPLTVEEILPNVTSPIALTALSQVGYIPKVENVTIYHNDLGLEYGSDWCGWFVWWCLLQADREDLVIEEPGWAAYWAEDGIVHTPNDGYTPQAGDIVTFDRDENGNVDHVGIVVAYEDGILYTVEGNTVMQGTEEGETPYGVYARYYDSTGWMYIRESHDN